MATRQEKQVGHDLIIATHRSIDRLWIACNIAQEVHPRTGEPLLYQDPASLEKIPPSIPYPVDKLVLEIEATIAPITQLNSNVTSFLSKADGKMVEAGLAEYGLVKSDITTDFSIVVTSKDEFVGDVKFTEDKELLSELGIAKTKLDWQIDKTPISLVKMADRDRLCNCANDALDALSYELRGKSSTTGLAVIRTTKAMDAWLLSRCKVARIEAGASGHEDAQSIIDIADWVEANKGLKPTDIADYIESHLDKLPLVRRHWEFTTAVVLEK